jgi:cell division initiation protein
MAITPADIEQMTFSEAKKHGYSTEEVDAFLDQLASEVDAMLQKIADLKGRLNNSEQQLAAAQAQVAQLKEQSASSAAIEPAPVPAAPVADYGASERQISQVLIVAQQSADKLLADARANADNIRNEADQKAREVIRQALAEKQNELDEIDRLKQSREDFPRRP